MTGLRRTRNRRTFRWGPLRIGPHVEVSTEVGPADLAGAQVLGAEDDVVRRRTKLNMVRLTRKLRSLSSLPRARPSSETSPLCLSFQSQTSLSSLQTVPVTGEPRGCCRRAVPTFSSARVAVPGPQASRLLLDVLRGPAITPRRAGHDREGRCTQHKAEHDGGTASDEHVTSYNFLDSSRWNSSPRDVSIWRRRQCSPPLSGGTRTPGRVRLGPDLVQVDALEGVDEDPALARRGPGRGSRRPAPGSRPPRRTWRRCWSPRSPGTPRGDAERGRSGEVGLRVRLAELHLVTGDDHPERLGRQLGEDRRDEPVVGHRDQRARACRPRRVRASRSTAPGRHGTSSSHPATTPSSSRSTISSGVRSMPMCSRM